MNQAQNIAVVDAGRRELNIAVVGAGPVGLSLALLLARQGRQVALFDAKTPQQIAQDPRTLALSQGSRELLGALDAWPEGAVPITDIHVSQQGGGLVALASTHLQARDHGVPALGYTVRYGQLTSSLLRAAEGCGESITLHHGLKVSDARAIAGTAQLQLWVQRAEAVAEEAQPTPFDLVVVCEGGLFSEQQAKPIHRDYAQTAYIATVRATQFQPGHAYEHFTPQGPLAFLPLAEGYAMVCCGGAAPSESAINAAFGPALGHLTLASPIIAVPLGLNAERTLVRRRTVRIGNAAQTLHPVAGQGFNLGLRDAWTLAALLQQHELDAALQRLGRARFADRGAMIAATDLLARAFTWQLPGAATARAAGLAALTALPPARRLLARWMMRGLR